MQLVLLCIPSPPWQRKTVRVKARAAQRPSASVVSPRLDLWAVAGMVILACAAPRANVLQRGPREPRARGRATDTPCILTMLALRAVRERGNAVVGNSCARGDLITGYMLTSRWREIGIDTTHRVRGCNCARTMMPSWSLAN